MKKNIIFPIEFNHLSGGMIHSVISLINALSADYYIYLLVSKDAEIAKLQLNATPLYLENPWCIDMSSPMKTIKTYFSARKLLRPFNKKDTLIFTNNVGSELIFAGFGIFPIPFDRVFVSRGGDYSGKTGAILKRGFKSVSKFIAISEAQKGKLLCRTNRFMDITVINNGVPSFAPKNKHNKTGLNLSVIGFPSENKNQILAIRALAIILKKKSDVVLNIFGVASSSGDVDYQNKMLVEIEKLQIKDKVFFKGFENDQQKIFLDTDILLSCSLTEGFGRTIAEGMSYGIPSIGLAQSGGLLDIITDGQDGFLIENDECQLADKILLLINDKVLNERISTNAKITFETKFTEKIMIDRYFEFIKKNF